MIAVQNINVYHLSMYADTLTCDVACENGNKPECQMNNSDLAQLWKGTRVFTPCTTNCKYVSS